MDVNMIKTNLQITLVASVLVIISSFSAIGQTSNKLITETSVGDIELGMTIAEARKVSKGLMFSRKVAGMGDLLISVKKGSKELMILNANEGNEDTGEEIPINENAKIASIDVLDSRYKTANGVHPKMTIAAAEKRYGKIKMIYWDDEIPEVGKFKNHPNGFEFSLEGVSNRRDSNGRTKAVGNYKLNDYQTANYKRGSYISSIMIQTVSKNGRIDDSVSNNLITATSVGDVKLGMTIGEARKALPLGFTLGPGGGSEGITFVGVFDGKKHLLDIGEYEDSQAAEKLPPINNTQKIRGITIIDSRFKTAEGVHVGMLIAEAEKKYGKLKEMFNFPHSGETGEFIKQPKNLGFSFREKGKYQTAGIYEEIPDCKNQYPPACSKATKYNPGSHISAMSISLPEEKVARWQVEFENSPKDIKAIVDGPTECMKNGDGDIEGKTLYNVWTTVGNLTNYQAIPVMGMSLPCVEEHQARTENYKEQRFVYYDDYNFDGRKDLALYDGNNGGYGFASYQIFLFSKANDKFVHSPSFTKLGQYQGMFDVDAKNKMLYNSTKSGCCFFQTDGYKVVDDKPVKVYEKTTDYTAKGATKDKPKVATKRLINGKWKPVPNEPEMKNN